MIACCYSIAFSFYPEYIGITRFFLELYCLGIDIRAAYIELSAVLQSNNSLNDIELSMLTLHINYLYLGIPLTGVTTKGSVVVHGGLPQNVG